MSAPQVGDVITTAEELDALPVGAVLVEAPSLAPAGVATFVRWPGSWRTDGVARAVRDGVLAQFSDLYTITLVYLPGQPPRPERVVKAEALREVAGSLDKYSVADVNLLTSTVVLSLRSRDDRIERGESS